MPEEEHVRRGAADAKALRQAGPQQAEGMGQGRGGEGRRLALRGAGLSF